MAQGRKVELNLGPYTIHLVRNDETDLRLAGEGLVGESDVRSGTIYVRSDLDFAREREVIVHELLHHVIGLTHLQARWSDDEQEEVIRALAPWLACAVSVNIHDGD